MKFCTNLGDTDQFLIHGSAGIVTFSFNFTESFFDPPTNEIYWVVHEKLIDFYWEKIQGLVLPID